MMLLVSVIKSWTMVGLSVLVVVLVVLQFGDKIKPVDEYLYLLAGFFISPFPLARGRVGDEVEK